MCGDYTLNIFIHQTDFTIADFTSVFNKIKNIFDNGAEGLHLLPELGLTGYPLQDLCLQKPFISAYLNLLDQINRYLEKQKDKNIIVFTGGLEYTLDINGVPLSIHNVIFELTATTPMKKIYTKRLLPNYDIFDEKKYFTSGSGPVLWNCHDTTIAVMICEDMWPTNTNQHIPTVEIAELAAKENKKIDLVVNLSASPFNVGKQENRVKRAKEISQYLQAPFVYVNRVGGEDEILFDGSSFVVKCDQVLLEGPKFKAATLEIQLDFSNKNESRHEKQRPQMKTDNTWESLYYPRIDLTNRPATLQLLSDNDCNEILEALKFGVREYAKKCNFSKFLVALSGGLDSSLVLAILKLSLEKDQSVQAIFMPGIFSSPVSYDLAYAQAKTLGVKIFSMPIKFLHSAIKNVYKDSFGRELAGLANENIQSRLRGTLLYAHANDIGAIPINTSNKSEIAVGYSTLYGDSVGAISMLGDLYKTEVVTLANYINRNFDNLIPEQIITRKPTAELRENQADEDNLPPYSRLDTILEAILSYHMDIKDMLQLGFEEHEIKKVFNLYINSEYKRQQFCPIIKVKPKSFGFGYRVPITKDGRFYTNYNHKE